MKKILFIAITPVLVSLLWSYDMFAQQLPAGSNSVKWMTWQQAVDAAEKAKKAGKQPKKMFVDIYTDWCAWCKKMDKTFDDPEVATFINDNYYPVKFNAETREVIVVQGQTTRYVSNGGQGVHELAYALMEGNVKYPSMVFLETSDFSIVQRVSSFLDGETFLAVANYIAGPYYGVMNWEDYYSKFEREREVENLLRNSSKQKPPVMTASGGQ